MILNSFRTFISISCVQVLAFYGVGNGQEATEMIKDGKNQYQLLQERGKLPRYGECWQSAVEHIHEGCRYLSEETQSDMALHITNCFLAMSGHEIYKCELDKKPNLRGICISTMSDRAFNVYTEFYTHTQNICWFLRGQIWQEKIAESTIQVQQQLKSSLTQQELLLQQQKESLVIQETLLTYGKSLEKVFNESRIQAAIVMDEIRVSSVKHQQLLTVMTDSLGGLQSWLIGEISWIDSLMFYAGTTIMIVVVTSTTRTALARLPLIITFSMNIIVERAICNRMMMNDGAKVHLMHQDVQYYVWWSRRITITIGVIILLILMQTYRDYAAINNALLLKIQDQNSLIRETLENFNDSLVKSSNGHRCKLTSSDHEDSHFIRRASHNGRKSSGSTPIRDSVNLHSDCSKISRYTTPVVTTTIRSYDWPTENEYHENTSQHSSVHKYNLRSRLGSSELC